MSTLKRSERNSIIEDYRNGVLNPNYEVIQTKTKGRYTVRKRKVPLTDEQLEQLNEVRDEPESMREPTTMPTPMREPTAVGVKRSKKENALFDLQNQLNTQMLYRLNELTNKVIKLKAWKKKVKQDLSYDEDDTEQPIGEPMSEQQEQSIEQQQQQYTNPEPMGESIDDTRQYLEQIPQQYQEAQQYQEVNEPTYEQQYSMYSARGGIDYSKFGF